MNERRESQRDQLRESWIESLLVSASRSEDHSKRVAQAMSQIEPSESRQDYVSPTVRADERRSRSLIWPTFGIAVAVSFALMLILPGRNTSALASIQRSLDVAAEDSPRRYRLQIGYRPEVGDAFRIDSELYVQGKERFALRHPGVIPGTSVWLGQNGEQAWVVPAIGPVLQGDPTILRQFLQSREELDTPFLHVTTMLKRMTTKGYSLKTLTDEQVLVPSGTTFPCRHIEAELASGDDPQLPYSIELWACRDTGIAVRVVARWHLSDGEIGRESVVLTFEQEERNLTADWFRAEGHYERQRTVIDSSQSQ